VVWIKNGKTLSVVSVPVTGDLALETATVPGDWFTIVVRAGEGPTAFANAIFIGRETRRKARSQINWPLLYSLPGSCDIPVATQFHAPGDSRPQPAPR
jgi:hypothetical protein